MVMRRTYNSQGTSKTSMGYAWDFGFNTALLKEYDSTSGEEKGVILKDGDGTLHKFELYDNDSNPSTPKVYKTPKGIHMTLTIENGKYQILRSDNIKYIFNQSLQIEKFTEPNGNALTFTYDTNRGNLVKVQNDYGDKITLAYNDDDLLENITLPNNEVINYSYDNENRLKEMSQSIENNETYHEKYFYEDGKLQRIEDPGQCKHNANPLNILNKWYTTIEYDTTNRTSKVKYANDEFHSFNYSSTAVTVTNDQGKTVSMNFNSNGLITKRTDQLAHEINYGYDDNYNVTSTSYQNQVNGSLQTINSSYTYDASGNIRTITDPLGNVTEYNNYNSFNKVGQIKIPKTASTKLTTVYTYDAKGNVLTETNPLNKHVTYTYDYQDSEVNSSKGLVTRTTDEYGNTTKYRYDTKGRVIKILDPKGGEYEVKAYDVMGNPTIIEDMKNNQTSYKYDELGRNTKITYADGKYETYEYDLNSNIIRYTDRKGFETTYEYDALSRVTSITQDNGDETTIEYFHSSGNMVITTTDPEGRIGSEYYDAAGRVVKTEQGGTYATYEYDNGGNQTKITDEDGKVVKAVYDKLGRQTISIINPGTGTEISQSVTYDLLGNQLTTTDGEGKVTTYNYDNLSRLTQVQQQTGGTNLTTAYQYDIPSGTNIINKTTYPNGNIKEVYLDQLGRTVKEIDKGNPNDTTNIQTQYQYDANGNLTKEIKNDGVETEYQYNNLNQLTKTIYEKNSGTPTYYTDYSYDNNGNKINMTDKKVTGSTANTITQTTYSYDELNRMTQQVQDGDSISFEYDGSSNVVKISYPEEVGTTDIKYNYDNNNRLTTIQVKEPRWSSAKTISQYAYTNSGKVDNVKDYRQYDSGKTTYLLTDYTYNTLGQINKIEYKDSSNLSQIKTSFSYQYDKRGYIIKEDTTNIYPQQAVNNTKNYTYDDIGRLKNVSNKNNTTNTTTTTAYTYDTVGNRLTMVEGSDNYTYHYNQFNQLTSVDKNGQVGTSAYQYDTRGNETKEVTKETENGQTVTVTKNNTYDRADRLAKTQVTQTGLTGTLEVSNTYNGDGQRVKKVTGLAGQNGLTTKYYYVGLNLLFTTDENGNKATENVLDPGGNIIASKRYDGNYDNMYFFYQYDVRGSVNNIINPEGTLVKGYSYDEFGNKEEKGSTTFLNEVTFTGAVSDEATGLYYMNARHYDPSTGRFLSQDTYSGNAYEPWTQHLYSYSGNNPVNYIDPTGHFFHLAVGAIIGAAVDLAFTAISDIADDGKINKGWKAYAGSAVRGAVIGAAAAATGGASLAATVSTMAAAGAVGSAAHQKITKGKVSGKKVMIDAATTALTAGIVKVITPNVSKAINNVTSKFKSEVSSKTESIITGKFSQITASPNFSQEGSFAGKTIGEVSNSLRSGAIKTSGVPVEYIMRGGNKLLLNTRSSLALKRAGIPEQSWTMVNRTGDSFLESMLTQRLIKNGLTNSGTNTLRITGNGRFMSNLK